MSVVLAQQLSLGRRAARAGWLPICAWSFLGVVVLVAVFGSWLAPYSPDAVEVLNVLSGPSRAHWFGTDDTGRDIFSRVLVGARPTVFGPAVVVLLSTVLGTVVAVTAAWFGGFVDNVISRALDIVFAFPAIIVAIIAVTMFGPGLTAPIIALSITYVPMIARILRSAALRERSLPYVAALQVQGMPTWRIMLRHIVPNLLPLLLVQATLGFGYALLDLSAVSYLGLGLQPPSADWGLLISQGQAAILQGAPEQALFPAALVVVTVVCVNLIGDRLSERFEVGDER